MQIEILNGTEISHFHSDILQMLFDADAEFVPPLSMRSSATQKNMSPALGNTDGVRKYFDTIIAERFVILTNEDKLVGFVAFRENYQSDEISGEFLPNIYISTLIVKKEGRGCGATTAMYQKLFSDYTDSYVFTRTWSTNTAHIKILGKFGFDEFKRLENDRGEGIDTVYFIKQK